MELVAVELHAVGDLSQLPVDADGEEALLTELLEELFVMPLTLLDDGGQEEDLLSLIALEEELQDLLLGIAHHGLAREVRYSGTCACIEEAEEVVDLRDGPDGRAGIAVRGLLLNRYDGAETCDLIDIRALETSTKEASGIGAERLDIAALALSVDGVECQGGLPATTQAGEDCQRVARDVSIHVLKVVHAGTTNI